MHVLPRRVLTPATTWHVSLAYYHYTNQDYSTALNTPRAYLQFEKIHPRANLIAANVFLANGDSSTSYAQLDSAFSKGMSPKAVLNRKPFVSIQSKPEILGLRNKELRVKAVLCRFGASGSHPGS